jgi:hypothetical protein
MDLLVDDLSKISTVHPNFGTISPKFGTVHLEFMPKIRFGHAQIFSSEHIFKP